MPTSADQEFEYIFKLATDPEQTQWHIEQAMALLKTNKVMLRQHSPKKFYIYHAMLANLRHDYEAALQHLEIADTFNDTPYSEFLTTTYLFARGVALSSLSRYDEALVALDAIVESDKKYAAKSLIIQCLLKLDDVNQASLYLSSLLNDYESNPKETPNPLMDSVISLEFVRHYVKYRKINDFLPWINKTLDYHSKNPLVLDVYAETSAYLKLRQNLMDACTKLRHKKLLDNCSLHMATYFASYDRDMTRAESHIKGYVNNKGWDAKAYLCMAFCQEMSKNHEKAAQYYQEGSITCVDRSDINVRNLQDKTREHRGIFPQFYNQEGLERVLPIAQSRRAPRMKIPRNVISQPAYPSMYAHAYTYHSSAQPFLSGTPRNVSHARYSQPAPTVYCPVPQQPTMFCPIVPELPNGAVRVQSMPGYHNHFFSPVPSGHSQPRRDNNPYNPYQGRGNRNS